MKKLSKKTNCKKFTVVDIYELLVNDNQMLTTNEVVEKVSNLTQRQASEISGIVCSMLGHLHSRGHIDCVHFGSYRKAIWFSSVSQNSSSRRTTKATQA